MSEIGSIEDASVAVVPHDRVLFMRIMGGWFVAGPGVMVSKEHLSGPDDPDLHGPSEQTVVPDGHTLTVGAVVMEPGTVVTYGEMAAGKLASR